MTITAPCAENVRELADAVVGHKIIAAEKGASVTRISEWGNQPYQVTGTVLHLDNGVRVMLADSGDCCAYTELEAFLLHPELIDHVITGVGTTGGYTTWHIYADMGDVLELTVGWLRQPVLLRVRL